MNCDQVKSLLGEILDEEVANELIAEIQGHLADCLRALEVDAWRPSRITAASPPCPTMDDNAKRLHAVLFTPIGRGAQ